MNNPAKGLIKLKGDSFCLAPERIYPMRVKYVLISQMITLNLLGWAVDSEGVYWVIATKAKGILEFKTENVLLHDYFRVPLAHNKEWFDAVTSLMPFRSIRELPQIYISGIA